MFYLRSFDQKGQHNRTIGSNYSVIHRESDPEGFRDAFKSTFEHVADLDDTADNYTKETYAFLAADGVELIPLYKKQKYYVMTGDGKTFDNVSYR